MTLLVTLLATRHALAEQFRRADIESAEADARLLIAAALGIDRTALTVQSERKLTPDEINAIDLLAAHRLKRECWRGRGLKLDRDRIRI